MCVEWVAESPWNRWPDVHGISGRMAVEYAANPHDLEWDEYFESRWDKRMLISPKGRAKLCRVWLQQGGRCCACLKLITKDTPGHSRHVVKLSHGGTDAAANLEIYHLRCPRDVQFANVDDV